MTTEGLNRLYEQQNRVTDVALCCFRWKFLKVKLHDKLFERKLRDVPVPSALRLLLLSCSYKDLAPIVGQKRNIQSDTKKTDNQTGSEAHKIQT